MIDNELIDIIQSRMTTSYNEQIWALTIVSTLCGFLIINVKEIIKSIDFKWLSKGVWLITGICFFFILSRFGIYWHYNRIIDYQNTIFTKLPWYLSICKWSVLFSGTLIYLTIIIVINRITILTCKKAYNTNE